jgi:hypothetical protein
MKRGERGKRDRFTWEQVDEIRATPRYYGVDQYFANIFKVHRKSISAVRRGITYQDNRRPKRAPQPVKAQSAIEPKWVDRYPEIIAMFNDNMTSSEVARHFEGMTTNAALGLRYRLRKKGLVKSAIRYGGFGRNRRKLPPKITSTAQVTLPGRFDPLTFGL